MERMEFDNSLKHTDSGEISTIILKLLFSFSIEVAKKIGSKRYRHSPNQVDN